jgi:hypothetical protein
MKGLGGDYTADQRTSIRRVALASFIGTAIEWYDVYLYGTAAALVFPKLFFPRFNPVAGTVTAEAAGSSPVVPAISNQALREMASFRRGHKKVPKRHKLKSRKQGPLRLRSPSPAQ